MKFIHNPNGLPYHYQEINLGKFREIHHKDQHSDLWDELSVKRGTTTKPFRIINLIRNEINLANLQRKE